MPSAYRLVRRLAQAPLHQIRLRERHVRLDPRFVGLMDDSGFGHEAFALRAFGRKQMAPGGMLTQNLARGGDFEALRDGFARFAAGNRLWHKARKIAQ